MRFPAGLAVDYYRDLLAYFRRLHENVLSYLPELLAIIEEAAGKRERLTDEVRADISLDPQGILNRMAAYKAGEDYRAYVQKTLRRVSDKVREDLTRDLRKIVGAARPGVLPSGGLGISRLVGGAITGEGRVLHVMIEQGFVAQNVALIKSIAEQYHSRVEGIVWAALRQGMSTTQLQEELRGAYNLTRGRARLIARDQVGKLYGQLNEARQIDVGIKHFFWRTVGDNRVRAEHAALNGRRFSWKEGANGLFPGQDYQCRCFADPDPEDIMPKKK